MAEEGSLVALPGERDAPDRSLALILKSHYVDKEFETVFASTELREHEIVGLSGVFATRFINMILATTAEDASVADPKDKQKYSHYFLLKQLIIKDPNAMMYVLQDVYIKALGLMRQSLARQSRKEAVTIASAGIQRQAGQDEVGFGQRFLSKLGIGKYRTAYVPKSPREERA